MISVFGQRTVYDVHYVWCVTCCLTVCDKCPFGYFTPDLSEVDQSGMEWTFAVLAEHHIVSTVWWLHGGHIETSEVGNMYYVYSVCPSIGCCLDRWMLIYWSRLV